MKVIILLNLLCISWQADDKSVKFEKHVEVPAANPTDDLSTDILRRKCIEELKLQYDPFEALGNLLDPDRNSSKYGTFHSCYWKKKFLLQENGTIDFGSLSKLVNYAAKITIDASDVPLLNTWFIATEIMSNCKHVQGKTHGEKAVKMRNCLFGKLFHQRNTERKWDEFEDIPNLDSTEEDCVNELKLDGLAIEDINRHYIVPENITEFSEFLSCYWKKDNIMDKNGNFNILALLKKVDEVVANEILSRSRAIYLSDIITESIIDGCKNISVRGDEELVLNVQNYILKRLSYFRIVI